jgi:uncharacterized membrane protein YtjA (UPF0391 family)
MVYYAVVFFVTALIASLLAFLGIAGMSAQNSWGLGVIATVFLAIALLAGRHGGFMTHRHAATSRNANVREGSRADRT